MTLSARVIAGPKPSTIDAMIECERRGYGKAKQTRFLTGVLRACHNPSMPRQKRGSRTRLWEDEGEAWARGEIEVRNNTVNEIIAGHRIDKRLVPAVNLNSGSIWSIQASRAHYCSPKDDDGPYSSVEVLVIKGPIPAAFKGSEVNGHKDNFGWLPVEMVNRAIGAAGGVKSINESID